MGPGDSGKKEIKLYMDVDGQLVEVEPAFAEITYTEDQQGNDNLALALNNYQFSVWAKLPKSMRCRSRKRFVKLLMSYEASRNVAEEVAKIIAWRNGRGIPESYRVSYQGYFIELLLFGKLQKRERKPYVYYGRAGGGVEAGV